MKSCSGSQRVKRARIRTDLNQNTLAIAETTGEPDGPTGDPGGSVAVQSEIGQELPVKRRVSVILAIHLTLLGDVIFLDKWCTKTMLSKIEPMKRVARMLRRHRPLLLNWFRAKKQFSSGIVEGFNTKAKLTTRKAYGFRTYHAAEIALYHTLGALPVPKTTHVFF